MPHKPLLVLQHKLSLSVGGIVRYRIKLNPDSKARVESLQFRVRNSSPVYRNITPASGPWKLAVALVRNPEKTPAVPELTPSVGCAQVCRMDALVIQKGQDKDEGDEGQNEWELEVLSEMVLQRNWVDVKVEVYAMVQEDDAAFKAALAEATTASTAASPTAKDTDVEPHILEPSLIRCSYKDTAAICGPVFPKEKEDLHLVVLTHGIHGTWLDMLYAKEQIDAETRKYGRRTVTLLTDTNHAGTEEGVQLAGRRVALDILQLTGYYDTEAGKHLKALAAATPSSLSKPVSSADSTQQDEQQPFSRGFTKISIIGHSLGGLLNIYALGYVEEMTAGAFFKAVRPVHFVTVATPLLGVGFEHPWVLGFALSQGVVGQTGRDLALENRSRLKDNKDQEQHKCELDQGPEPLLVAMAQPGSVSNRVLTQFKTRTSYANIENDMAVKFNTSSMMGIPSFDMEQFFSPEGAATQPRKNLYSSAISSTLALLFPNIPSKAKYLEALEGSASPIVIVSHVDAVDPADVVAVAAEEVNEVKAKVKKNDPKSTSPSSSSSSSKSVSRSSSSSSRSGKTLANSAGTMSRLEWAKQVAEGYHLGMDWTKIGVFIEHEAHVQIIVRRKWYNLEGWKVIRDLVERHDFS